MLYRVPSPPKKQEKSVFDNLKGEEYPYTKTKETFKPDLDKSLPHLYQMMNKVPGGDYESFS